MSKYGFVSKQWSETALLHAQIKTCVRYIVECSAEGLWAPSDKGAVTLAFHLGIKIGDVMTPAN